uniref:Putative secreted protein n=1 Tax=Anopheles marajoara TaxID=58244 RepID=A0A2M4CCP2_9DIPT
MFVLLLLVLSFHHQAFVHVFHRDLLRCELLHIQVDLELIVGHIHRRTTIASIGHTGAVPRANVASRTVMVVVVMMV